MRRTLSLAVAVALAAAAVVYLTAAGRGAATPAAAAAPGVAQESGILVSGLGRVSGVPDVLRATLGVSVEARDVTSALRAANASEHDLTVVLGRDGVASRDVQTSDVSVNQAYDSKGRPSGYGVNELVTVKLRDLSTAGRALGDAVTAGGNAARLQGVSFALEDNAALLEQARSAAYADAHAKAARYADLAGRPLGAVELVTETQSDPQPVTSDRSALSPSAAAGTAVPLNPGQSDVTVTVTVRWAL